MVAFEVSVNGERRYVMGHRDAQALYILMNANFPPIASVRGLVGVQGSVAMPGSKDGVPGFLYYPSSRLSVGDQITIRIVEVDTADEPMKPREGPESVEIVADAG